MEQEQKPFEIKEVRELQAAVDTVNGVCLVFVKSVAESYIESANAEIRRLQNINFNLNKYIDDMPTYCEVMQLKQQLADAPTWGEWLIGTICNLSAAKCGLYEVEMLDGSRWGLYKCDLENSDICRIGWIAENGELVCKELLQKIKQFRRLNYEPQPAQNKGTIEMNNGIPRRNRIDLYTPAEHAIRAAILAVEDAGCHPFLTDAVGLLGHAQNKVADFVELEPAREVEKTYDIAFYDMNSGEIKIHPHTAQELADGEVNVAGEAELARDLLAAQAELRELKGEK